MIKTIESLKQEYANYQDINGKIKRDVDQGKLFSLVKGVYETNRNTDGFLLSSYIYGPSYLSFEYALSYHGLIPERVYSYTNATFNKRKKKLYQNVFGLYTYRDVPKEAFPFFVKAYTRDHYAYFIATPEKALCDLLYIKTPVKSMRELKSLLFDDLRLDENIFQELDGKDILFLTDKYKSNNLKFLKKYIESER